MNGRPPNHSGFGGVDRTHDPTKYVLRLDHTGSLALWQGIKQRMAALLAVRAGDRVLDVGCGTGDDARTLAARSGASGLVVGIDRSQTMIDEARARTVGSKLSVAFARTDAHALCFADGSFDACRCERALQHLDAPWQALAEMIRVVRPGGRVVLAEPDYGTLAIRGADPATTRRIVAYRCAHFRSGKVGRHLGEQLRHMGLIDLGITLLTSGHTEMSAEHLQALRATYTTPAQEAGVIATAEAERWLADLCQAAAARRYCHAATIFLASGRKDENRTP